MMRTTKDLLPAINSLYDFGLTEQEMQNLTLNIEKLQKHITETDENTTLSLEDRLNNNLINSISHIFRKGHILFMVKPWDKYNKENICIRKLNDDKNTQLIEDFEDSKSYYNISLSGSATDSLDRGDIIVEKFMAKDLKRIAAARFLIGGLYEDAKFSHLDHKIRKHTYSSTGYRYTKFKSSKTFVDKTAEAFFKTEDINSKYKSRNHSDLTVANLLHIFKLLYPDALITKAKLDSDTRSTLKENTHLRYILAVLEHNNYRLAVSIKFGDSYYSNDDINTGVSIVPHTHDTYNYVDVERLWLRMRSRYYTEGDKPFGDAMFIADDPVLPRYDVIKDYLEKNTDVAFLDNPQLTLIAKRYLQKQTRMKAESDARERLANKIQSKLNLLKTDDGELKINDVIYTKDKITYQDQELVGDGYHWVYDLLRYQTGAYNLNNVTFDTVFSAFVDKTKRVDGDYGFSSGTVGNVNFNIESQVLTNKLNISSTRWKINGYRVNTAEIHKCIERAICFEDQSDYDYFISSVSSCSLKMHRYLQLGLDIAVRDHFDNTEVVIKFPLERIKNLNYLVLNDREYKIRNTEKLLRLERADTIIDVINTLLSGEIVENVDASDVKDLIDAGKQAYIDAVEKSKELLESCEKVLGVSQEHIELKDGNSFTGYRVKGSLRDYAVNATDERYSVYDADTASYICIVDKTNSAQAGLDRLVNRLYALANDSRVATKINTLKQRSTQNES